MTSEQFNLLMNCISTIDVTSGKLLIGADPRGKLIYTEQDNPLLLGVTSTGRSKSDHWFGIKDHTALKAAFGYVED